MESTSSTQPNTNTPHMSREDPWDHFGCLYVWQWLLLDVPRFEALVPHYYSHYSRQLAQIRSQRDALLAEHADYLEELASRTQREFPKFARMNGHSCQAFVAWHTEFLTQRGLEATAAEALVELSHGPVVYDGQMLEVVNALVDMSRDATSGNRESSSTSSTSVPAQARQVAPGTFIAPIARMVPEAPPLTPMHPHPTYLMNPMALRAQRYENAMPPLIPGARAPSPIPLTYLGRVSVAPMSPRTPMAPTPPLAPMPPMRPGTPPSPSPGPRFSFGHEHPRDF